MIKEIPLYLTYRADVSDVIAQVVTTPQDGAVLRRFKGSYRKDATTVIKTYAEYIIENGRYTALNNNEGYLYYIVPTGPGVFYVHVVYGASKAYPDEVVLKDNTLTYALDDDIFTHAFATDVELTSNDIQLLVEDPSRIEDVWDDTTLELFSFNKGNMVSLVVSSTQGSTKYLPFSAGVSLYEGIICTSNHMALTAADASIVYTVPPGYAANTMYVIFYDTLLDTWTQFVRTSITTPITEIEVFRDHHGFALLTRPLTQLEMDQLCQHHNLLIKVFFDGFVLEEGFKVSNIIRMYPGTEGLLGGEVVTDVVAGDTATINNYKDTVRTSLINKPTGIQDFYIQKDTSGVITGTEYFYKIRFDISYLNSRFINMFKEYTIIDMVMNDHRIRTYKVDNEATIPVGGKLYINGITAGLDLTSRTPNTTVALDGAGEAITIGNPSTCLFEVLPYYITADEALAKYTEHIELCPAS